MKTPSLSKSKVVLGVQCQKALYLSVHNPKLADEVNDSQQMIFDQGHEVGILAQKSFPNGVLIDAPYDQPELALKQTEEAVRAGALNIYEATLRHENVLVKVDILTRKSTKHAWNIVEVKSSTEVKDVHLTDAAIQLWVCCGAGLKVTAASIMTINNQCVYPDLKNLFNITDVSEDAAPILKSVPNLVKQFTKMLSGKTAPEIDIGPQCDDPYSCAFSSHCWSEYKIPEISVFDIPRLSGEKKWALFRDGKSDLKKLNPDEFNVTQRRMIEHTVSKKRFVDSPGIKKELKSWKYPLSFLDFETISFAIPRYKGQRPYEKQPFQFSCHIRKKPGTELIHREYLHTTDSDPRELISKALVEMVPKDGNVVAYNMGFESSVLKALAQMFPKYRKDLLSIVDRLVDPLPIFRAHVYDPAFKGSFSIKELAPAILGASASYEGMSVGDGTEAQFVYLRLISPNTNPKEKEELRRGLIEYCTKDTMGMVLLVDWLMEQITCS